MRLSRSARRLAPLLCLLATVSVPGQAQTARDDDNLGATARKPDAVTADPLLEGGPALQVRAPMLDPQEVGADELELIEPRAPDRVWKKRAVRAASTTRTESDARHKRGGEDHPATALSAVPSMASSANQVAQSAEVDARSGQWPKYGLIASLLLAALFLFWRLGERARPNHQGLIGCTGASASEQTLGDEEPQDDAGSSDDQPGSRLHETLRDAVRAMKAAPRATRRAGPGKPSA